MSATSTARGVVLALVMALVAAAAPAVAQDSSPEPAPPEPAARHIYRACPAHEITESEFVETALPQNPEIECLAWYGITSGVTPRRYRPGRPVTRGEMATFIANLIDESSQHGTVAGLPDAGADQFTDLGRSVHARNINRLAGAGIVQGGPDGRADDEFGPGMRVRRDQMASFLNGAQEFMTGAGFVSANDFFADDDDSVHEANINGLAEWGVTVGRGSGYAPGQSVTRRQMAAFLMRLMDVNVFAGRVLNPAERDSDPDPGNQSFVFREIPDTADVSATELSDEGATQFEVGDLGDQAVSLALFRCANVTDDRGVIGFRDDADPEGQADFDAGRDGAVIETVNGEERLLDRDRYAAGVEPQDGMVTFTADSTTTDCVIAVAFADANGNDALDLDAENLPTEKFGVSSSLLFQPPEADGGAFDGTVLFADPVASFFVAETDTGEQRTYRFAPTDDFAVDDAAATYVEFQMQVSRGDDISGEYLADGGSSFRLTDAVPLPPPDVTAELDEVTISVTVRWAPSPSDTVTGYRILRLQSEHWLREPCAESPPDDMEDPEEQEAWSNDIVEGRTAYVVGEVSVRHREFVDRHIYRGYAPNVCYLVRAIDRADQSDNSSRSNVIEIRLPDILRAEVTRDAGRTGILDAGDRHRFVFSRQMQRSAERASRRDSPAQGNAYLLGHREYAHRAKVTCIATGPDDDLETTDCTLNRGDVTIDGTTYGPGRVLVVNVGTNLTNARGGTRRIEDEYPLRISDVPDLWQDLAGNPMRSPDNLTDHTMDRP